MTSNESLCLHGGIVMNCVLVMDGGNLVKVAWQAIK